MVYVQFNLIGKEEIYMQYFKAEIIKNENGRLVYITLPFDAKEIFHITKGTIYVEGKINDVNYRSKLISRGKGIYILVLNKDMQKRVGFCGCKQMVDVSMRLEQEELNNGKLKIIETMNSDVDVVTAIKTRRSIRKFKNKRVDDKLLYTILNAGLQAPTAKNKRPYHFIVVKDKDILGKLAQCNPNARMLENAACGIIVCGDSNIEGMKEFLYADCAAATQNILLCSHGLGVGAVWCGVVMNSEWKKLIIEEFDLPLKVVPTAIVAIGYPDEEKAINDGWESSKIHFDKW